MPSALLEARFNQLNSGLHGFVSGANETIIWRSGSAIEVNLEEGTSGQSILRVGERRFSIRNNFYSMEWAVLWQTEQGEEVPLVFRVLETVTPAQAQLESFRRSLFLWLGGSAIALLFG